MPLVACCSVKLRFPKQCGACPTSSICQNAKPIATWNKPPSSIDPVEVPETNVPVTFKLPPRTVELLRKYARSSGLTIGAIVADALNTFLRTLKRHG